MKFYFPESKLTNFQNKQKNNWESLSLMESSPVKTLNLQYVHNSNKTTEIKSIDIELILKSLKKLKLIKKNNKIKKHKLN